MATEEKSLYDEIANNFDEEEEKDDEEIEDSGAEEDPGAEEGGGEELSPKEVEEEGSEEVPKVEEADASEDSPEPVKVEKELKPPVGYGPESRELWKDVPQKVKAEIHKREVELATTMQNTAAERRTAKDLNQLGQNYAAILAAEGAESPLQAAQGLFQTVAELRMGTPQQKAAKMVQLIDHYGISVQDLDNALVGSGQAAAAQDPNANLQNMINQAVAPLYQQRDQEQQYQQQQAAQSVNTELQEFAKTAPYLNDVRQPMANLIDAAAQQGRKMSFKEAYDACCAANPEISGIIQRKAQEAQLQSAGKVTAIKKNAASSLSSRPGHSVSNNANLSLRGELEELFDQSSQ